MGSTSWSAVRRTAWVLVAIGILGVGSWVVTKALGARSDATFDQWVGWANVLALPVGALGTALVLLDRASRQDRSGGPGAERRAGPAGPTPRPPGSGVDSPGGDRQTQHIHATAGGTAQGVMFGNIINHPAPPRPPDHGDDPR